MRPPARHAGQRLLRRPAGDQSGDTVWLFDLDNTLHDASHAIFPVVNERMTAYVARVLDVDTSTASRVRTDYWKRYGATLLGMMRHHGVDAADFLAVAHEFPDLAGLVRIRRQLVNRIRALPGRKIILTNAPEAYAHAVLRIAGLQHCFERVIAIEQMWVHGQLRPKPDRRMLHRLLAQLRIAPHRAVLVEDTVTHLKDYAGLGIRTAWVTGYLRTLVPSQTQGGMPVAVAQPALGGAATDAAVRSTLEAEDRSHAGHRAQETAVGLVAAEAQTPPAPAKRVHARTVRRPGYVDIKVQSTHQLQRQMRRIGS